MKLKTILKSNKFTSNIIIKIRKIQFKIIPSKSSIIYFNIRRFLRATRIDRKSPYEKLKDFKNKHKAERCFIVATGPSLTIEDLEKLNNEVTFSMNSIFLAFDETDWRPTYYGIQYLDFYEKFENAIKLIDIKCKFIADVITKNKKVSNEHVIYPLNLLNHTKTHKKYHTKFSNDAFAVVYDGYTITYSIIQLAVYMGFEEIYLIGADCNYPRNMNHHFKNFDHVDPTYLTAAEKMICGYKEAKKYADRNNIKIFNATRGGMLEVFERVDLDEVLLNDTGKEKYLKARSG